MQGLSVDSKQIRYIHVWLLNKVSNINSQNTMHGESAKNYHRGK